MNASPENPEVITIRPPQLIQSLVGGFNAVASHIYIILIPVVLDLLLWFGPHMRVKALFEPEMLKFYDFMRQNGSTDMKPMIDQMNTLTKAFFDQYNLAVTLSTFPIGVPSQMAGMLPLKTPVGTAPIFEIHTLGQFFLGWLLLTIAGFILTSLYFSGVARTCRKELDRLQPDASHPDQRISQMVQADENKGAPASNARSFLWQTLQVIAFVILLTGIFLVMMVPALFFSSLLYFISPVIAPFGMLLAGFVVVWFMAPLLFSPHGIFLYGQSMLNAMMNSTRVVRHSMPATGLFLLSAIVLSEGLSILWNSPPETSWMSFIGIFGHAFISTGLLAASFFFYRGGLTYVQSLRSMAMRNI